MGSRGPRALTRCFPSELWPAPQDSLDAEFVTQDLVLPLEVDERILLMLVDSFHLLCLRHKEVPTPTE